MDREEIVGDEGEEYCSSGDMYGIVAVESNYAPRTTMTQRNYFTSDLTKIYTDKNTERQRLHMSEICETQALASFSKLRDHLLVDLRYPIPQDHKLETFGFTLSLFRQSEKTFKRRSDGRQFARIGLWRQGEAEEDSLSAFYADIDNANTDSPIITPSDAESKLRLLGVSYIIYTSFSHSASKPKFRVIIDTDRALSRAEQLKLAVYLDWEVFGHQCDPSIYDPADFLFAPPHTCETFDYLDGAPIVVDRMLADLAELQRRLPECWARFVEDRQPQHVRRMPAHPRAATSKSGHDLSTRVEIRIDNPAIFNPAWQTLYRDRVSGGHWETMRSLLGMVWTKTKGSLTFGEMRRLLDQIDATGDGYLIANHGEDKAADLIDFIMSRPIEQVQDDRCSLLDQDEIGLTIAVKQGECGEGKTRNELQRIAREKKRYVYVVDKIENIAKRRDEFFELAGQLVAIRFLIKEAHSQSNEFRVPLQLATIRNDLDREKPNRPALIFVTQQSAAQMNWHRWSDFEIIMDEVPDCFQLFSIHARDHAAILRRLVEASDEDGSCYRLSLTSAGHDLARRTDVDDYDKVHHGLCVLLAKPNTFVWVKQSAWEQVDGEGKLEFFAIVSPFNLSPFKAVRLLGDEAMNSVTVKTWSEKWGVDFKLIDYERRQRTTKTSERITIRYFSDHRDSSITRFKEGDLPLEAISNWIKSDAEAEPVLWTANERLKSKVKLAQCDYIPPKAHGRNDLIHYKRVAWLAAMKASKFEIGTLRQVCGMTAQELVDWREFNAMYQFIMRGIIRDFASPEPMVIYVFSRQQAEYLHGRLGGKIEKIDGVIIDQPARCLDEDGPMTAAERQKVKYWREKMIDAKVADVRDLPKGAKLTDREVRLVNLSWQKVPFSDAESRRIGPNLT